MADPHAATRSLLEDRPELAEAVADAIETDAAAETPWTFDDLAADSGAFGELVSRGIVESEGEGYRVADPEAVRAAHEAVTAGGGAGNGEGDAGGGGAGGGAGGAGGSDAGGAGGNGTGGSGAVGSDRDGVDLALGSRLRGWVAGLTEGLHRDLLTGLLAVFAYLFLMRIVTIGKVFRGERVFLPGNDPYHFLHGAERLVAADVGWLEIETLSEVMGGGITAYPLTYTIGWAATKLFGGGEVEAAAGIVAWIPVVSALLVGGCVYLYAVWTTGDERVALASVLVFALLPGHALYSGIGFIDHHTIDYAWLALTVLGVLWLARSLSGREVGAWRSYLLAPSTIAVTGLVGVVIAAMVHSWGGSPILLVGLAVSVTLRAASDIRTERSPLVAGVPVIGALAIGFGLAFLLHTRYGWQESMVVFMPLLVAIGGVLVVLAAVVVQKLDLHPGVHLGAAAASVVPLLAGFARFRPADFEQLRGRVIDHLLGREGIAETRSLVSGDFGYFFGSVDHFGWFLFFALPALIWVGWRCAEEHRPEWLVLVSYAASLLGFAVFQIRFAGEATAVTAVFAAVGMMWLLGKVELVEPPTIVGKSDEAERTRRLERDVGDGDGESGRTRFAWWPETMTIRRMSTIALSVMLIGSLSLFLVPGMMDTVAISDAEADAAAWIDEDAEEREGPNYVLSNWGRARMYNYQVSGGGSGYGYARNNYQPFVNSTNPDGSYNRFSGRVGYIAIERLEVDANPRTTYAQLFEEHGSATSAANGSGHFRLVHVADRGGVKVFRPVPGASIVGQGEPGATVRANTTVTTFEEEFAYTRRGTANENGTYTIRVAYPGEYTVGNQSVQVSNVAVENGTQVAVAAGS
ncbi:hypothetical protein [Halopenitus persicus]|uniref:dolichyl-phosphooligosaccharide-protein glycotransferase n=1 Tax=Halopenitus persicus TaxID=1048396 RepID=A0A1H3J029_9EURY|nr:hypothetical protein [Halopenitus persicus]SDY33310.1 dolichyl-diphosphooligosaccharide--protein glycosyltransferase [Halopenitus persicus]